jgi:hypothetical protein
MASLVENEPIGTTARLGVLRLGAGRLGALPPSSQLTSLGTYAWHRSDGMGGDTNDGQHPSAVSGGWTTSRS